MVWDAKSKKIGQQYGYPPEKMPLMIDSKKIIVLPLEKTNIVMIFYL